MRTVGRVSLRHNAWASRPACRGWARQSRRKPCLYCEPDRRRDAVSGVPDVPALDTPAASRRDCPGVNRAQIERLGRRWAGRLPACEAAPEPHLQARLRRRWVAVQTRLLRALTCGQSAGCPFDTTRGHPGPRVEGGHVAALATPAITRAECSSPPLTWPPLDTPVASRHLP